MNQRRLTIHLDIAGLVQGVGYRQSMLAVARSLGLHGWVRNRGSGAVEATVQGNAADVDQLVAWCHNGPPDARVESVRCYPVNGGETFTSFTQRPSI